MIRSAVALLVAVAAWLPWGSAAAQERGTIIGVVVEAGAGPLAAAHVELVESHRSESTRVDGGFAFPDVPAGTHTLAVQRIGYAPRQVVVQVDAGRTTEIRIELQVAAVQFEEIVVTGTITSRAGQDVLSPTSVVSAAELERKLDATVAATLADEPGVAVTGLGPATARPVIRGMGGDRIVMLEDGVRSGDMSSTSADHAVAIDPLTAQRMEVVRGPMSLLYGSSALGGVVNVVREEVPRTVPDHFHGAIVGQAQSVNTGGTLGGFGVVPIGRWAARFEASGRASGDVSTPSGTLGNTDARTWNLAAGVGRSVNGAHLGASYRFFDSRYGIPDGAHESHDEEPGAEEPDEEHAHNVHVEMQRHSARGELDLHHVAFFEEVEVTGSYTNYTHREVEEGGEIGTEFLQDVAALNVLAHHDALGLISTGALGFSAQYRDIETGGELATPSTRDVSAAVFVVEEVGRGPLRLQAGARYDVARYEPRGAASIDVGGELVPVRDREFSAFSGSLGLLYEVSEPVRVGVSVARAYRTPDFNELYTSGPHLAANSFDVGDPGLDAETGTGIDAFVRYQGSRIQAELAAFRNQLDGYVFPSSRGRTVEGAEGLPLFQYTNEDARFTGIEGGLDLSITKQLVLEATGSVVRAEFTSERAPIPVFVDGDTTFVTASKHPPLIPPAHGRVALRYETADWFAGVGGRFAAEQDRTGDFEEPTAAYAVADLTGGIRFLRGGRLHTLTLRVDNLLDAEYRDHLSRIKEIMPQPGIGVSLLYRLAF